MVSSCRSKNTVSEQYDVKDFNELILMNPHLKL